MPAGEGEGRGDLVVGRRREDCGSRAHRSKRLRVVMINLQLEQAQGVPPIPFGVAQGKAGLQAVLEMSAAGSAFGCGSRENIAPQERPAIRQACAEARRTQDAVGGGAATPLHTRRGLPVLMRGVVDRKSVV